MLVDRFAKPALLLVDMQNDFVRVGPPMEVPQARDTISQHHQLFHHFRNSRLPIVYTRFLAVPKLRLLWEFSPKLAPPILACHAGHKRLYADIHQTLECIDIIDELAPKPEDFVIDKLGYGAFHGTKLDEILRQRGVESLIVTGTVTQICVEETAREAFITAARRPGLRCSPYLPDPRGRAEALCAGPVSKSSDVLQALAPVSSPGP
jgi:nicotinamidase-related amidase